MEEVKKNLQDWERFGNFFPRSEQRKIHKIAIHLLHHAFIPKPLRSHLNEALLNAICFQGTDSQSRNVKSSSILPKLMERDASKHCINRKLHSQRT